MSLTQTQAVGMDLVQPKSPQLIYVPIKREDRQLNRYQLGTHGWHRKGNHTCVIQIIDISERK